MSGFWDILELQPTQDISVIRRAYARKTLTCHPEEDPEGFLRLRRAYQAALDHAERSADGVAEVAGSQCNAGSGYKGADTGEGGADGSGCKGTDTGEGGADGSGYKGADTGETDLGGADFGEADLTEQNIKDEGWTLVDDPKHEIGPNPYTDHEAILKFLELYTGKQRKDQKRWLDYFTSDAFLDAAWDWRFTALLLEQVTRLEGEYPVNREFLIWLCVAYQFTVQRKVYSSSDGNQRVEYWFQNCAGARFQNRTGAQPDWLQYVFEIAKKGPTPKYPKGNELAMMESFTEYRRLLSMAEEGVWSEQEIEECSEIIGHYAAIYITDKCQQRGDMDHERHPAGLRLMTHFFRRDGLPEELYRIAWQRLNLETAVMGREKIFYGALRGSILERMPELAGQQREKFTELRAAFHTYAVSTCKLRGENARATEEDIRRTEDFFAREDFQRALLDRRFVEEEMLHTWVNEDRCDLYLRKVMQFYTEHAAAPCAERVIDRAKQMLRYQKLADRRQKDKKTEISEDGMTFRNSAFFRHWLNTGFYQARDPESGRRLLDYLNQELPYLPEWSKGFLGVTEGKIIPRSVTCTLDGDEVEILFHLRYMEFLLNRERTYRPWLKWKRLACVTDTDTFFFCLPVTVASYDEYEAVKEEILRRLEDTAAPEDGRSVIAACLAEQVCSLPAPGEAGLGWDMDEEDPEVRSLPPKSVLPFTLFAEDTEHLYGCEWFERSRTLLLFEQLSVGRQNLKDGLCCGVADAGSAVTKARQMLAETLSPPRLPMELLVNLPDAVYAMPDFGVVCTDKDTPPYLMRPLKLLGGDVTSEKLEELLTQFANERLNRLEWSWNIAAPVGEEQDYDARRSLVFLKEDRLTHACLYFDDFRAKSFALLKRPELYGRMNTDIKFVSFRRGKLFNDVIYQSFSSIRRRLDVIFQQVSWPNNVDYMAGNIWDHAVNVSGGRSKYNLDKQLLADFPMERAHNRPDAPFYFFMYPESVACVDDQGGMETLEVGPADGGRLQQMMLRFLQGGFRRLRLTFGKEEGRRKHIVLLQDGGRFLMAWLQEEKQTVRYHVADTGTYMNVEGKKYPKETFQGRITPAYLIHNGITPLRNALELLLANLDNPSRITDKMAEYADEKPVKARSYEELWAELVGDTL